MAGNKNGPEGSFFKLISPKFRTFWKLFLPIENEVGVATPDLYVADDKVSGWIELKSVFAGKGTIIDLSHFTGKQRLFMSSLPACVGGCLIIEVIHEEKPNEVLVYNKDNMPPAECKVDYNVHKPNNILFADSGGPIPMQICLTVFAHFIGFCAPTGRLNRPSKSGHGALTPDGKALNLPENRPAA